MFWFVKNVHWFTKERREFQTKLSRNLDGYLPFLEVNAIKFPSVSVELKERKPCRCFLAVIYVDRGFATICCSVLPYLRNEKVS